MSTHTTNDNVIPNAREVLIVACHELVEAYNRLPEVLYVC